AARLQGPAADLVPAICKKSAQNPASAMPGYTHLQRAQPVTFGHALMAYAWMLLRDLGRLVDATRRMDSQCPLGSGALAGTTYPLERAFTAEKLGLDRKSTRLNSSHVSISYAIFCWKKKRS